MGMRAFCVDACLAQPKNPTLWGLRLSVTAESMRQTPGPVEDRYPEADTRVVFPPYPDAFFAADPLAEAGSVSGCRRASRARYETYPDAGRQVQA